VLLEDRGLESVGPNPNLHIANNVGQLSPRGINASSGDLGGRTFIELPGTVALLDLGCSKRQSTCRRFDPGRWHLHACFHPQWM
jgi:hypothetical protein